jgi:hypothetical protein
MTSRLSSFIHRLTAVAALGALAAASQTAQAVPSFTRQTGQDCVACHIGGFGPQLTPMGIKFKLGGYTDSDGKKDKTPVSAMIVASYKHDKEDTKTSMDEASIFLAGKLTDKIGAFVQVTNDGESHHTALDAADIRFADTFQISGQEALIGVSVNNAPTVQDPFNTFGWAFPYTGAEMGGEFAGMGVEQRVIGVSAYTLVNENFYGEFGLYNTLSPSLQSTLGEGRQDGVDLGAMNNAPYWRVGYMKDLKTQAWSVGLLGFQGKLKDRDSGNLNSRFNDFGVDASYQFLGNREHIVTINGSYLRERNTMHDAESDTDTRLTTRDMKLAASYHYKSTYGATVALVNSKTRDTDGATHAAQRGYVLQGDWTPWGKESSWGAPWANVRVGLQYAAFTHVTEDGEALDKPSDLNKTTLFLWTAF